MMTTSSRRHIVRRALLRRQGADAVSFSFGCIMSELLEAAKRAFDELWAEPLLKDAKFCSGVVQSRYSQKLRASSCSRLLLAEHWAPYPSAGGQWRAGARRQVPDDACVQGDSLSATFGDVEGKTWLRIGRRATGQVLLDLALEAVSVSSELILGNNTEHIKLSRTWNFLYLSIYC